MTGISQKKERCPKNSYFGQQIKNFHKSKIDGLQKLSTRAPQFYEFLHFKGCSYLNPKISFNLSVEVTIFLVFHNPLLMLFHILSPVSDHELMLDNFLLRSSVIMRPHNSSWSRAAAALQCNALRTTESFSRSTSGHFVTSDDHDVG